MRFLTLQAAQVQAIESKDDVHQRKPEDCDAPSEALIRKVQDFSDAGPDNIVRERPEIALLPDLGKGLVLHQRDDRRYWKRISSKIGAGRRREQQRVAKIHAVQ